MRGLAGYGLDNGLPDSIMTGKKLNNNKESSIRERNDFYRLIQKKV